MTDPVYKFREVPDAALRFVVQTELPVELAEGFAINITGTGTKTISVDVDELISVIGGGGGALDPDLVAIAGLSGTGIAVRTSTNVWAQRQITATLGSLAITNPAGVAGDININLANDSAAPGANMTYGTDGAGVKGWKADPAGGGGPLDPDLVAIAALAGTGFSARTAADTWALRTWQAPAAGITISNPAGIAGNPALALANDLAALEGLGGTGIAVRTAADTWAQRSIAGTAGRATVTNGDGVAANPTIDVPLQMSITNDGAGLKLSGDATSPGANKVYGTDGAGTKGWKNDPAGGGGGTAAMRNRIINPSGSIAQRSGPATWTGADDTYDFDRWYALTESGAVAPSQLTDVENTTPFMMRQTQSQVAAQRFGRAQIIEGVNCKDLRGQQVVLSSRVRMSAAATLRYVILEGTGTLDVVTSDVVNNWASGTYTPGNFFLGTNLLVSAVGSLALAANTLTSISLAATLGATFNNLIVMFWTESQQAQNVTLDIGKVKLELGAAATTFEEPSFTDEQQRCQRYFNRKRPSTNGEPLGMFHCYANNTAWGVAWEFPTEMRATPGIAMSAVADFVLWNNVASAFNSCSSIGWAASTKLVYTGAAVITGTILAAGDATQIAFLGASTATAWLDVSAEL